MNFYSVIKSENRTLVWDLVEFDNGNIAGYNHSIEAIFLFESIKQFVLCEKKDDEEIIKDGVIDIDET